MAEASTIPTFVLAASDCSLVQFDGWDGTMPRFEAELGRTLGGPVPQAVGETVRHAGLLAIRIAPRRLWLLCDAEPPAVAIDPEFGCSLDLGEGRVRLRLSGARLKDVLERCVAVDWDALAPGRAVQTGFHKVPVLLLRTGEAECDLIVPRSFARSLSEWIVDAAGTR